MGITAAVAINQARDVRPEFDVRSTPNAVALRRVATYQQELLAAIAETRLDALHVDQTIALPLADFDAGAVLQPHLRFHGATVFYVDTDRDPTELELVEYPLRTTRPVDDCFPLAYLRAGVLHFLGVADDWTDVASIVADLFPQGPDALAMTDELMLPGSPMRACVADLAAFMGVRAGVDVPDPTSARESYLDEVTERRRAKVGQIREVWSVLLLPLALSGFPPSGGFASARDASARAIRPPVEVSAAEGVPLRAPRLFKIPSGDRVAPKHVLSPRDGLQMARIHAPPVSASVVQCEVVGNRADEQLVRTTMHEKSFRDATNRGARVGVAAIGIDGAWPRPARVRVREAGQPVGEAHLGDSTHVGNLPPLITDF